MFRKILLGAAIFIAAVYLWNASWLAPAQTGETRLIAHRGTHQNFDRTNLTNDTCTATRILEPIVPEIENTLVSMRSAFAAGADLVELDVHPTTDGKFAVFHDWTLDCRTEGTGETRSHDMAYLKTLDVGYGYTADGGQTFPLRGTGIGLMPELSEVMAGVPEGKFIVNFKSKEAREGDMLKAFVDANPQWAPMIWGVYGGDPPTNRSSELMPELAAWTRGGLVSCLLQYEGYGWTGIVPEACRNTTIMVPINFAGWLWGWPNRFMQRMQDAGTNVILIGSYSAGDPGTSGIDTLEEAQAVPAHFPGFVWTNEITTIAPIIRDQN
ncbi:MAG: glycerophosphodiester phosphodiesterase [Hyphomicrobiales bacterium]|nr:MAG: glycerophosphodiester phosphodiesterase [Hyphomicrobiales bacterium]